VILLALLGCPRGGPALTFEADPAALLGRARAEAAPGAVYAPFSAVLAMKDNRVTAGGNVVVVAPDRFRVELRGPIGPPQLVVACDGDMVRAYLAPKNLFVEASADAGLATVLGAEGGDGARVATSLLLGRVPILPGEPTLVPSPPGLQWSRGDGAAFSVVLDAATAHLAAARANDTAGRPLLDATWTPGAFPGALNVTIPSLTVSADVKFGEWSPASPSDAAFVLARPEGAETRSLVP